MKKVFEVPVVFTVEAEDYEEASELVNHWVDKLTPARAPENAEDWEVPDDFVVDGNGNRILYLDPDGGYSEPPAPSSDDLEDDDDFDDLNELDNDDDSNELDEEELEDQEVG